MKCNPIRGACALGLSGLAAGALLLGVLTGCAQDSLERGLTGPVPSNPQELMAELQAQRDRIDRASEGMVQRIDQFNAARGPGEKKIQFSELFFQDLSPEQRDVLDQLLAQEKNPTYRNLLENIVADRKTIQTLQEKVLHLEQQLPDKFILAKRGDTHFSLAQAFLTQQGVPEDESKSMLNQIDLSEDLVPGFKVWYNYNKDDKSFRTYVTQGEAGQTPLAVKRALKRKLITERDSAYAKVNALERTKMKLKTDIATLEGDVQTLETRRAELDVQVSDLEARNGDLQLRGDRLEEDIAFRRNSLAYYVGSEGNLAKQGVLTRFLKNLKDVKGVTYEDTIDLRQARTISFAPQTFGLKSIRGVEVWPGVYKEGRDYSVQVSSDGGALTVHINDPEIFKQQRVLFALRGEGAS